ncbi:GNAT family N-acetyltransferase [Salegentibacter sp. Hel_I_6]|uniref:GNAT family N-acetyltransferase n=1 Tax=Salegentibacter sp. Hel_I_6 TaxID=1250278 RepID=UPI00068EE594|nr:GNAT family N-acetyltransferase [Salegentibacter sp. Hel_I_6]
MKDFEVLDWDSDFFGVKVAKIDPKLKIENYNKLIQNLDKENIELAYFNSDFVLPSSDLYEVIKLDNKIALSKKLGTRKDFHPGIRFYTNSTPTPEMFQLSKRIARRSKFYDDANISKKKVYELYELWLDKSVKGILADAVIVYEENGVILGLVSIKINEKNEGIIPLLGVDAKHEGKSISFYLMAAVETYLLENNCEVLISSTQAQNLKALKVYERFGVHCEKGLYINHLWRKPIAN